MAACTTPLPTEWTAVERIQVATILLRRSAEKTGAERSLGWISTVLSVLNEDPATLNAWRNDLAAELRTIT